MLKQLHMGERRRKPAEFCLTCGLPKATHTNITDLPLSGRPPKLSTQQLEEAFTALIKGRPLGGDKEPYSNWPHFT